VADSEGGFWTSRDEDRSQMTGGLGYGRRARVCEEVANVDEVVLVYPKAPDHPVVHGREASLMLGEICGRCGIRGWI